ncbi:MAG: quinolinate synthase NadA, partial [Methanocalculus sp.]
MMINAEIQQLKKEKNALILAHNYQMPEIQDVADLVGDSLELAVKAAVAEEPVLIVCGVLFMAETAKLLSPEKTVLIPVRDAG